MVKVSSFDMENSRIFKDFKNVRDIKALTDNALMIYEGEDNVSIVNIGNSKVMSIKNLFEVKEVNIFSDDLILIIKEDGSMIGFGDEYNKVSKIVESIKNAKNLYIRQIIYML